MARKLKLVDKSVLHIVDSYVVDGHDWRVFWEQMGEMLQELRGGSRERV